MNPPFVITFDVSTIIGIGLVIIIVVGGILYYVGAALLYQIRFLLTKPPIDLRSGDYIITRGGDEGKFNDFDQDGEVVAYIGDSTIGVIRYFKLNDIRDFRWRKQIHK